MAVIALDAASGRTLWEHVYDAPILPGMQIEYGSGPHATPLVAGLCGLILSLKPDMTVEDIRAALIASAKKIGPASAYKANGHSNRFGYGRIDAAKAVTQVKASKAKTKKTKSDR